jgi:hypothetical protein
MRAPGSLMTEVTPVADHVRSGSAIDPNVGLAFADVSGQKYVSVSGRAAAPTAYRPPLRTCPRRGLPDWGKKILEWSSDPQAAFATGRKRPVFGTVRSMTASGLTRKADMEVYVSLVDQPLAAEPSVPAAGLTELFGNS